MGSAPAAPLTSSINAAPVDKTTIAVISRPNNLQHTDFTSETLDAEGERGRSSDLAGDCD